MSNGLLRIVETQLDLSLRMVEGEIEACPDALWNEKAGGFVFWQQILHALTGTLYWTREEGTLFEEPFKDREVFPELEAPPKGSVAKEELRDLAGRVRSQVGRLLAGRDDSWLAAPCGAYGGITNADALLGQVRHLMYHAGHCDSALRERGEAATEWLEVRP